MIGYYIKKTAQIASTLLFPWGTMRGLKNALSQARIRAAVLSDQVMALRIKNKNLTLQQKDTWLVPIDEVAGMLNWPELINDVEKKQGFIEFMRTLSLFANEENIVNSPSSCWNLLGAKNCDQLVLHGYNNFKRTIGHNYFNFLVQEGDIQIQTVESLLPAHVLEVCRRNAQAIPHDPTFSAKEQFSYNYFVFLLWEYAKTIDKHQHLEKLEEPKEGNPILVADNNKQMSQDLANSLIEYYAIDDAAPIAQMNNILEIGSGYGRNAHVTLSLNPHVRIFLVDIWPALYIAQRYLSSVFKDRKVFRAQNFACYSDVKAEMDQASLVFLLPHQLMLLPDKMFDLCMNISSFGEMKREQIDWYFKQINRLTNQCFYTKQWYVSKNPFDGLVLNQDEYPTLENWQTIYSRSCAVQSEFFETLYQVN